MRSSHLRKWNQPAASVDMDRLPVAYHPTPCNNSYQKSKALPNPSPPLNSGNRTSQLLNAELRRKQQRGFLIQSSANDPSDELACSTLITWVENQCGFLFVTAIIKSSPADDAGIRCGDVFVKFGEYTKATFSNLSEIPPLIRDSVGKTIPTTILRQVNKEDIGAGYVKIHVELKPAKWTSGGVLGFVLNTWPPPRPRPWKWKQGNKENRVNNPVQSSSSSIPVMRLPLLAVRPNPSQGLNASHREQPNSREHFRKLQNRASNRYGTSRTTATLTFN